MKMHHSLIAMALVAIAPLTAVAGGPAFVRSNNADGQALEARNCNPSSCHKCVTRCPLGCIDPFNKAPCISTCRQYTVIARGGDYY